MKLACSGLILSGNFPREFGDLLNRSRSLDFNQLPDYEAIRKSFASLAKTRGYSLGSGPLDWTPCHEMVDPILEEPEVLILDQDNYFYKGLREDSYRGLDIDCWEPRGERGKGVTLSAHQEAELDSMIATIEDVHSSNLYAFK